MSTPGWLFARIGPKSVSRQGRAVLGLMLVLLAQLLPAPVALAAPAADTPICYNLMANGSFEQDSIYWRLTDSTRPPFEF